MKIRSSPTGNGIKVNNIASALVNDYGIKGDRIGLLFKTVLNVQWACSELSEPGP